MRERVYHKETKAAVKNGRNRIGSLSYFPIFASVGIAVCDRPVVVITDPSCCLVSVPCFSYSHERGIRSRVDHTVGGRGEHLRLVRTNGCGTVDPTGAAVAAAVGKFYAMALGWLWEDGAYA